jgi:hypothetical protein
MGWASGTSDGQKRSTYRLLLRKPEGKRPVGRPRLRWVYNIRMDLGELGWGDGDWIDLAQDRDKWKVLVYTVMYVGFHICGEAVE